MKTVSITYDDHSGNVQNYKVITDQNGKGYLTIDGEDAGTYDITITFGGDAKYNGCSVKQTLTVEDGSYEATETTDTNSTTSTIIYNNDTSNSSANPEQTYYDPDMNVVFDKDGYAIGGQEPGKSIYEIRNNPPQISEDGSLE